MVAQELREYGEARQNYQQAIAICIEFGDRYSQASTYQCLGSVAEDLEEFPEAENNFLQALTILHEFDDEYIIQIFSIPSFSRIYQATQDDNLLLMLRGRNSQFLKKRETSPNCIEVDFSLESKVIKFSFDTKAL
jgi:tetratricopeptide (TPR) repeat protein